jgi:NifU-like protein involved in Fe-S cluster formation
MAEEDPLGPRVRALFMDLAHAGDLLPLAAGEAQAVCTGEAGRTGEGTRVRFSLRLSGTRVEQVRYRAYGCPFTLATCEWLARELPGCELHGAVERALEKAVGTPAGWAATLGVPAARLGRLLVVEDALRQALAAKAPCEPTRRPMVRCSVTDPDESMTDSG